MISKTRNSAWSLVVLLVLLVPVARAKPVAPAEATRAIETWVRHVTADARADATVATLEPHVVDGRTVAYIAHLDDGYCICGADDRLLPVYLYRPMGAYDPQNPNYRVILGEIATRCARLEAAQAKNDPVLEKYRRQLDERAVQWRALVAGEVPARPKDRSDPAMMTLPLTSRWHQYSPFNDYCPELTPNADEHVIVGCVATAMAQIMYYWQWPPSGSGSVGGTYSYRFTEPPTWLVEPLATDPNLPSSFNGRLKWESAGGGKLMMTGYWDGSIYEPAYDHSEDADYRTALSNLWDRMERGSTDYTATPATASYDWAAMPDTGSDPPSYGDLEAAEVSYHAGVALDMNYGRWSSSTFTSYTPWAYSTIFGYSADAVYTARNETTMIDEIRWLRLVQIRGSDEWGGHSWVVAGYNTNVSPTQFLMNFGWGDGTTEWYTCDDVFPNAQGHAINIVPESVVRFVDYGTFGGDGSPDSPYLGIDYALTWAPDDTTLIFKAGTTHHVNGSPAVLDRPMTLKGQDITIGNNP